MFDVPLAQLTNLTSRQKAVLKRAGLSTPSEVLLPPRDVLAKTLKPLPRADVDHLVDAVARGLCPVTTRLGGPKKEEQEGPSSEASGSGGVGREEERFDVLSLGDAELDQLLGGGFRKGMITEIVGESSAGKSQLCLLLALSSQLRSLQSTSSTSSSSQPQPPPAGPSSPQPQPHASSSSSSPAPPQPFRSLGSIAYLSSEGKHPSHAARLQSLAAGLLNRHPQDPSLGITIESLTSNILFDDCHDVEALDHTISYRIPALIARLNPPPPPPPNPTQPLLAADLKGKGRAPKPSPPPPPPLHLIILDSLAALIRTSYPTNSSSGLSLRSASLCSLSDKLKSLALIHNLAIVVVNQVTDVFYNPWKSFDDPYSNSGYANPNAEEGGEIQLGYKDQSRWFNGSSKDLGKEASLGLVWANCVNGRVMISRTGRYRRVEPEEGEAAAGGKEGVVGIREPSLIRRMEVVFGSGMKRGRRDYVVWEEGIFGLKPAKGSEGGAGRRKSLKREREEEEEEGEGDATRSGVGVGTEEMLRSQSGAGAGVEGLDVVDLEGAVDEGEGEGEGAEGEDGGGGSDQEDEFGDDSWMNGMGADGWDAVDGGVTSGTI